MPYATEEKRQKHYQRRRKADKAAGKCVRCHKRKASKNNTKCHKCRHAVSTAATKWDKKNAALRKEMKRLARIELKISVYKRYGGAFCVCCGEDIIEFLTMDHINGGGRKHRETLPQHGSNICAWLKQENYPPGFQVLCSNCQNRWRCPGGICPHKRKRRSR